MPALPLCNATANLCCQRSDSRALAQTIASPIRGSPASSNTSAASISPLRMITQFCKMAQNCAKLRHSATSATPTDPDSTPVLRISARPMPWRCPFCMPPAETAPFCTALHRSAMVTIGAIQSVSNRFCKFLPRDRHQHCGGTDGHNVNSVAFCTILHQTAELRGGHGPFCTKPWPPMAKLHKTAKGDAKLCKMAQNCTNCMLCNFCSILLI